MKRTSIATLLLFAMVSTGCNRGKDEVLPDGTKLFGHIRLKDGTEKAVRLESPDGMKQFDVSWLPDGSKNAARATFPDGTEKLNLRITKVNGCDAWNYHSDSQGNNLADKLVCSKYQEEGVIWHADGGFHSDVDRFPDGQVDYNVDKPKGGERHIERTTHPDGTVLSDITSNPLRQNVAQLTDADGTKHFGVVFKCEEGKCVFESQQRVEENPQRLTRRAELQAASAELQAARLAEAQRMKGFNIWMVNVFEDTLFISVSNPLLVHSSGNRVSSLQDAANFICQTRLNQGLFKQVRFGTDVGDLPVPLPVACK